jgi:hypothetical protein
MTLMDWLRKNSPERSKLALKYNGCTTHDPYAICGEQTDSVVGPELFLEDSWRLVCDICGERYAPELLRLKDIYSSLQLHATKPPLRSA